MTKSPSPAVHHPSAHSPGDRARIDVHASVTQKIIAAIEAGAGEFQMPWHRPGISFTIPKNALTDQPYRGTNILSLWIDADEKKFEQPLWATYRQWGELGAQVRKGEKGSLIVKYGEWTPKDDKPGKSKRKPRRSANQNTPAATGGDGNEPVSLLYAKAAWVFNAAQVDGFTVAPASPRPDLTERLDHVDRFIGATRAEFRESGQRAFYRHPSSDGSGDFIQMPPRNLFIGTTTSTPTEAYESTRLHEVTHWSGAKHRLNRDFGERFGDKAYAFEELVAEISAAFLCAELEITNSPRLDHAQYIAHWLEVMKADKKAVFAAASAATTAVTYLKGLQPADNATPTPDDARDNTAPERPVVAVSEVNRSTEGPR